MPQITGTKTSDGLPQNIIVDDDGRAHVLDDTAHAGEPASGESLDAVGYYDVWQINATGLTQVCTGACIFGGFKITGNAGALNMDIYDNTAASGLKLIPQQSVAAAAEYMPAFGRKCYNGIAVNMSGDPTDDLIVIFYKALP